MGIWALDWLKQWAEVWLAASESLDLWNACTLLHHAHECHATQLKNLCVSHIQKFFKFVGKTPEWRGLPEDVRDLVFNASQRSGNDSGNEASSASEDDNK